MRLKTKRVLATILSGILFVTGIYFPGESTSAAETTKVDLSAGMVMQATVPVADDIGDGSSGVELVVAIPENVDTKEELAASNINSLVIKGMVTEFTSASGETSGIQAYMMSEAWNWYDGNSWTLMERNKNFTLSLDLSGLDWGGSNKLGKIGLQFTKLMAGTSISYELSEIYFSSEAGESNTPNSGGSSGGTGSGGSMSDTTTDLNLDIEYNFARLLQDSLYFYDGNMCGDVAGKSAFSWRGDCHTYDGEVPYTRENGQTITVDVSGGYHDAGDHVKFGLPQGYAASGLALAYYEFGDAFDELGQTAHFNIIMDHFCEYFSRCMVYKPGSTDELEAFCYQVGDGDQDHTLWTSPESQTKVNMPRPAFFATASNPGTDEVSVAACALALTAVNYEKQGGAEAMAKHDAYLKAAKDLFAFAKKNEKRVATLGATGFYGSGSWEDDYVSAAMALYVATKDTSYQAEANKYYSSLQGGWCMGWNNTDAIAATLKKDTALIRKCADVNGKGVTSQGFKFLDEWGSARLNTSLQFAGLIYDKEMNQFSLESGSFGTWATGQMKYLLGNNSNKRCFVVGYNENASKNPHHRAAAQSENYVLLGALVGGPADLNDSYADDVNDYKCNEVALDYNVGLVGASAGLYLLHKENAEAYPQTLTSEDQLSTLGLTKFYTNDGSDITPTANPTAKPTANPTAKPTASPTAAPTASPTARPTQAPTQAPTAEPTQEPTQAPTAGPTLEPTQAPTAGPTQEPTQAPTAGPTQEPTHAPTTAPTQTQTPGATPGGANKAEFEIGQTITLAEGEFKVLDVKDDMIYVSMTKAQADQENYTVPGYVVSESGEKCYVTEIANNAFANCKNLKTVTIQSGIVKIGNKAFYKCTKLRKMKLPVTLKSIGNSAFEGCSLLTAIILPKNLEKIGKRCFYGCKKLKTVTFKTTRLKAVGAKAFKKIKPKAVLKIKKKQFKKYTKLLKKKYDSGVRFKKIK